MEKAASVSTNKGTVKFSRLISVTHKHSLKHNQDKEMQSNQHSNFKVIYTEKILICNDQCRFVIVNQSYKHSRHHTLIHIHIHI